MGGEDAKNGPWGRNIQATDALTFGGALDDGRFIDQMFDEIYKYLMQRAKANGISLEVERKKGIPSILTLVQIEDDIASLQPVADEILTHANALPAVKARRVRFASRYIPSDGDLKRTVIIIDGQISAK